MRVMYCWNCFSRMEETTGGWKCPKCGTALGMNGEEYEPEQETKADRIRKLSDETLAELLFEITKSRKFHKKSKKEWLEWLKLSLKEEQM